VRGLWAVLAEIGACTAEKKEEAVERDDRWGQNVAAPGWRCSVGHCPRARGPLGRRSARLECAGAGHDWALGRRTRLTQSTGRGEGASSRWAARRGAAGPRGALGERACWAALHGGCWSGKGGHDAGQGKRARGGVGCVGARALAWWASGGGCCWAAGRPRREGGAGRLGEKLGWAFFLFSFYYLLSI
jgi:hypothetical protein